MQNSLDPDLELEFILRLKIKLNDWLLADTCPQTANHYALFWVWDDLDIICRQSVIHYMDFFSQTFNWQALN